MAEGRQSCHSYKSFIANLLPWVRFMVEDLILLCHHSRGRGSNALLLQCRVVHLEIGADVVVWMTLYRKVAKFNHAEVLK